jgi:peroxiredoxin
VKYLAVTVMLALGAACAAEAKDAAVEGHQLLNKPAPPFTLNDLDGNAWSLEAQKGHVVVLEWFNPDCPFVVAAHGADGPLRSLPARWAEQGVTWVAINSGAPGKQGHGVERNKAARTDYAMGYPVLVDERGTVGRQYGAKHTPTMVVIASDGNVAYYGALDNAPRGQVEGSGKSAGYRGWTDLALQDVLAGRPLSVALTKPWGCSVKYAD